MAALSHDPSLTIATTRIRHRCPQHCPDPAPLSATPHKCLYSGIHLKQCLQLPQTLHIQGQNDSSVKCITPFSNHFDNTLQMVYNIVYCSPWDCMGYLFGIWYRGGQICFILQMYDVIANTTVYQLNWALKIDRKLAGSDCARK